MRQIVAAVRAAKIQTFVVPHHRSEPGDYTKWRHPNPSQIAADKRQTFAKGRWGGEWHPILFPRRAMSSSRSIGTSGFANTDLDQQLKQHGIEKGHRDRFAGKHLHRVDSPASRWSSATT